VVPHKVHTHDGLRVNDLVNKEMSSRIATVLGRQARWLVSRPDLLRPSLARYMSSEPKMTPSSTGQARKPLSRIALGQDPKKDQVIKKHRSLGLINWKAALLFLAAGGALTYYFQREKKRLNIRREEEANQGMGTPSIGGPFDLIDHNGKPFTHKDLEGKFSIIYFGFSMCPDICPEELENMAFILNNINKSGQQQKLRPVFITCDPNRDSPEVLKEYLVEFHPDIIGLTGPYEEIKKTCKAYRVYFSTPPDLKPGDQYLVDHSIFFYLMDPEGRFIEALGRNYKPEQALERIKDHMDAWVPRAERETTSTSGWFGKLFS
jgi:protein SCO1/2